MDLKRRFLRLIDTARNRSSYAIHSPRVQTRLQVGSAIALGAGLLLSISLLTGVFYPFQNRLTDFVYRPIAPRGQVIMVLVDDAALSDIGAWPWPRATIETLIDRINASRPAAVAISLLLPTPSAEVDGRDAPYLMPDLTPPPLILPVVGVDGTRLTQNPFSFPSFGIALNLDHNLRVTSTSFGHAMLKPDEDGVLRRAALAIDDPTGRYPALGVQTFMTYQGVSPRIQIEGDRARVGDRLVPLDADGNMYIRFSNPGTRASLSAGDVIHGRVDPGVLQNKIIVIGLASPRLAETYETPLRIGRSKSFAVEIHADIIETLLGRRPLADQDRLTQITMIFLAALMAGATLPHFRWLSAAGLTITYLLVYLGYAFQKFDDGILVQPFYPIVALVLTFAGTVAFRELAEERPRARVGRLFQQHVGPEAIDRVLAAYDQGQVSLRGIRKQVTVMHVDLRDLTVLASSLTSEATMDLINRYVQITERTIFECGGSIVRSTGNTVLSVWNLPLNQSDHANQAMHTAVEIQRQIKAMNSGHGEGPVVSIGVGVATGQVIAGRLHSADQSAYTIVGEIVNEAERLAARRDGGIFLTGATHALCSEELEMQNLDPMRLRRKTDPVDVWQVVEPMELEPIEVDSHEENADA